MKINRLQLNITRKTVWPALLLSILSAMTAPAHADDFMRGLWPTPNANARNTRRAELPGRFTLDQPPREIWRYGDAQRTPSVVVLLGEPAKPDALLQIISGGLEKTSLDGAPLWDRAVPGAAQIIGLVPRAGGQCALVQQGVDTLLLVDLKDGSIKWRWLPPKSANQVGEWRLHTQGKQAYLAGFPKGTTLGLCFVLSDALEAPRQVWKQDYAGRYDANCGPLIVLADMDGDRTPEIVLAGKPAYVGVIDLLTGQVKFDLKYSVAGGPAGIGRPYGLLQATDLNGDGLPDIVMASCQVEEYLAVIRNVEGKSLELVWSRFIEKDFPEDDRQLAVNIRSVANVTGNARPDLVIGLWNQNGDQRWHTLVLDPMVGIDKPLADWPDAYLLDCIDSTGGGTAQVIVSMTKNRALTPLQEIQARDASSGKTIATLHRAMPQMLTTPSNWRLPSNQAYMASPAALTHMPAGDGRTGVFIHAIRETASETGSTMQEIVWTVDDAGSHRDERKAGHVSRIALASMVEPVDIPMNLTSPGVGPGVSHPLVCRQADEQELVLQSTDGAVIGGVVDFAESGKWKRQWRLPGGRPVVWQLETDRRLVVVPSSQGGHVNLFQPIGTEDIAAGDAAELSTPRINLRAANIATDAAALLPYGDAKTGRLIVAMRTGRHKSRMAACDVEGKLLWEDAEYAPYPAAAGAGDLNGDGLPELVVDDHGKQFIYDRAGKPVLISQAWHNTVPGRGDGAAYALPIIGPFGPNGETRIVMSPGLVALELLDTAGGRLARKKYADVYVMWQASSAVAQTRSEGQWDIGMIDVAGLFHCVDLADLTTRWTVDLGTRLFAKASVVAGDIDNDGHDEFIVGLPDGRVLVIGETQGKGVLGWTIQLPSSIAELVLADVDGDGYVELIVSAVDGTVRVYR